MKINNIKNIFFAGLLSMFILPACVDDFKVGNAFLEKAPGVDVTKDSIFGKAEYARRFLWNTYSGLYYGLPIDWSAIGSKMNMGIFESLSDVIHSHLNWDYVNKLYYAGSYNAGMEDTSNHTRFGYSKEGVWETVRKAWIFIENVDNVPDMTEEEKKRLKAEAKVIIVTRYFDAYRHFGGLPLVRKAYEVNDEVENPRATVEETNKFMLDLLDEAIPDLPWVLSEDEYKNWDGRMTMAAAMGLKCKILLFTASPLFNDSEPYCNELPQDAVTNRQVWIGEYKQSLWEDCRKACDDFFRENENRGNIYGLVQATGTDVNAYRNAFRKAYYTRGSGYDNPEMLISTRVRYTWSNEWDGNYYFPQSCKYGAFTPTQEFMEMFPMADGTPFNWDNSEHRAAPFFKNKIENGKLVLEAVRDPRLYETITCNQSTYQNRKIELWIGGREAQNGPRSETSQWATGYGLYKFILDMSLSKNKPQLWPYLRMAEIYLIYAEALLKTGDLSGAVEQVNKVRNRVGLKGLDEIYDEAYLNDPQSLMNEILRERACELGFEDVRFFDLIRNKMKNNFTTPLHGLRIYRNDCFSIPSDGVYPDGEPRFRKIDDNNYVKDDNGEYIYKGKTWSNLPADERGPEPTSFSYEKFELSNQPRYLWKEGNFNSKWYLTAFPPTEVNKEYGLTQNPGW